MKRRFGEKKSCAIWIKEGDARTKFFLQYANSHKHTNTIWEIEDGNGILAFSFSDKVVVGVNYFKSLFIEPRGSLVLEMFDTFRLFP